MADCVLSLKTDILVHNKPSRRLHIQQTKIKATLGYGPLTKEANPDTKIPES